MPLITDPEQIEQFRRIAHEEGEAAARRHALRISEEDGAPSVRSNKGLKVTNGSLTHNADGTLSLATGAAGGGGTTWLDKAASGNAPGGSLDDEFDGAEGVGAPTGWTATAISGTAVWTEEADVLSCLFGNQTASDLAIVSKPIGALTTGDYIETAVRALMPAANFTIVGLFFSDGITGASNVVIVDTQSNNLYTFQHGTLTNVSTAFAVDAGVTSRTMGLMYLRLTWVSANTFRAEFSPDGVSWAGMGFADGSKTMTPTHMGLAVSSWGGTSTEKRVASFEYFRTSVA
jgi:hypothetical protein